MKLSIKNDGFALPAVLLIVVLGALAVSSVLVMSRADSLGVTASARFTNSRAMAWSGVQAAMTELGGQREALLRGERPTLTESWVMFDEGGRRGIVRLLRDGDQVAHPEAAKLDINTATVEMLAVIPGLGEELAARVVAARSSGPFQSAAELLRVRGIDARMLYGDGESDEDADPAAQGAARPLVDLLTVFSFDPQVSAGVRESSNAGEARIDVSITWSDELGAAITTRLGDEHAPGVIAALRPGQPPRTTGELYALLTRASLSPATQAAALDELTVGPDAFVSGLVDLTHAPAAVLAAVPGFDDPTAQRLVSTRQALTPEQRADVLWPVTQAGVGVEAMSKAIDHLTVRSLQWRIRVEAGLEAPQESSQRSRSGAIDEQELRDRVVFDVVVDLTEPRPRLAYFREATLLETAAAILIRESVPDPEEETDAEAQPTPAPVRPEPVSGPRPRDRVPPPRGAEPSNQPEAEATRVSRGHRVGRWKVLQEESSRP